jgi:hypothetical protein
LVILLTSSTHQLCYAKLKTHHGKKWTTSDESKRIAQIKEDERRLFEQEVGIILPAANNNVQPQLLGMGDDGLSSSAEGSGQQPSVFSPSHYQPQSKQQKSLSAEEAEARKQKLGHTHPHTHHPHQLNGSSRSLGGSSLSGIIADEENQQQQWCFHCVSPWSSGLAIIRLYRKDEVSKKFFFLLKSV